MQETPQSVEPSLLADASADAEEHALKKKLPVMEIFGPTVQGEGSVIGQQTYFIRFGLCDYRCVMCDSMHAVDAQSVLKNADWLIQDEIFLRFNNFRKHGSTRWITLSGGNPCIHNLDHLVDSLTTNGFRIAVETQGTFAPDWLWHCDVVTVSPKSPGMGERFEQDKFRNFIDKFINHSGLAIKIVVFSHADLMFAKHVFDICTARGILTDQLYLSQGNMFPPGLKIPPENHVDVLRTDYLMLLEQIVKHPTLSKAKFLPQWHVWLWGNRAGV